MFSNGKPLAVCLCLLVISCSRSGETVKEPATVPSPTIQTSPARSESEAPRERGDTSPSDFVGTVDPQEQRKTDQAPQILKDVRFGQHDNYDRIVFEFTGKETPGFRIEYATQPLVTCGAGEAVAVEGNADLVVQLTPANAHNDQGQATVVNRDTNPAMRVVRQAKLICDFEGEVQWLLGLTERHEYRVMELKEPARLVIDIKHSDKRISRLRIKSFWEGI